MTVTKKDVCLALLELALGNKTYNNKNTNKEIFSLLNKIIRNIFSGRVMTNIAVEMYEPFN